MEKRKLGRSSIDVAPLALGGNVFGWTADEPTSFQILDTFVDAGLNLVDTADVYSKWVPGNKGGESETIIGTWLKRSGKRNKVVISTKIGWEWSPDKKGLSRDYILRGVEDSLRRLQTDYIDLYQSHKDDPDTPIDETLDAFTRLVKDGKVRVIGASNFTAERLQQSLDISTNKGFARYESLQPEYNLYARASFEAELEPLCLRETLGVIPYYSLASGFLTGKYRSKADAAKSPRGAKAAGYLDERGIRILDALDEVAERHSAKAAHVALAWLMARPSVTAPIASATSLEQLQDLIGATRVNLAVEEIETLNTASSYQGVGVAS